MKALTLTQPWASLIAFGEKKIETRSWSIDKPQRIGIHAAKGLAEPVCNEDGLRLWVATPPFSTALGRHGVAVAEQLPRACVIAAVDVIACIRTDQLEEELQGNPALAHFKEGEFELEFGDYGFDRWAWLFDNLEVFDPPIPYRGGRKLWEFSP